MTDHRSLLPWIVVILRIRVNGSWPGPTRPSLSVHGERRASLFAGWPTPHDYGSNGAILRQLSQAAAR